MGLGFLMLLSFLMLNPFIGGLLLKSGWVEVGQFLSRLGFYWLGIFFVIFCVNVTLITLAFIQGIARRLNRSALWIDSRGIFLVGIVAAICINFYGFFEANRIGVTQLDLVNPDMSPLSNPVRIVQISDVHYGLTMLPFRHQNLLKKVSALNPDIIVSTGDFLDHGAEYLGEYMDAWQALQPRLGKYAVIGNHEVLAGFRSSLKLLGRAGFRVLSGEWVDFGNFRLVGLDDPRTGLSENLHFSPDDLASKPGVSILLNHRPGWPLQLEKRFDLALAGHTHGGQIFPFGLLVYFTHGILSGLEGTPWGGWNYISRGVGTWGPPVRLLASPEITLLVMRYGKKKHLKLAGTEPVAHKALP